MKKWMTIIVALVLSLSAVTACAENETVQVIMNAGTTQAFSDAAVAEEDLNTILQAGLSATSAINQQPWFFAAVTNQEIMAELGGGMSFGGVPAGGAGMPEGMTPPEGMSLPENMKAPEGMTPPAGGQMPAAPAGGSSSAKAAMGDSPVAIIIYMNENTSSPNPSFDCGLACQNMVIAASTLGYGTKIISSPTMTLNGANHDALCEKFGVDPAMNAVAVLLIGQVDADATAGASVRNTLEKRSVSSNKELKVSSWMQKEHQQTTGVLFAS